MAHRACILGSLIFVTAGIVLGAASDAAAQAADPVSKALYSLSEYGVLGIAVILLVMALIRKDRQVNALYIRLVEKAEKDASKYHQLADALNDTLKELTKALTDE